MQRLAAVSYGTIKFYDRQWTGCIVQHRVAGAVRIGGVLKLVVGKVRLVHLEASTPWFYHRLEVHYLRRSPRRSSTDRTNATNVALVRG